MTNTREENARDLANEEANEGPEREAIAARRFKRLGQGKAGPTQLALLIAADYLSPPDDDSEAQSLESSEGDRIAAVLRQVAALPESVISALVDSAASKEASPQPVRRRECPR